MRMRYESEHPPLPIDPKEIAYTLHAVDGDVAATVPNPEARFRAHPAAAEWIREEFGYPDRSKGDCFEWKNGWRSIPYELLEPVFSFEELLRLRHEEVIMSSFGEWFDAHHPFLRKIMFAHWHYGCDRDWNMLVRHLEGFKRLSVDLPDFDVRIVHTRTINQCAWAWAEGLRNLYLDASFGLLLYHRGEHVLTWSFAPCRYGILVAQAQLRRKRGNRFLFKLPKHYLDLGLDILTHAFTDEPIWLIGGKSSVEATRRNYGPAPCSIDHVAEARIAAIYDRPLGSFHRGEETIRQDGRTFVRLHIVRRAA